MKSGQRETEMKEKRRIRKFQKNTKISQNQVQQQKSHQKNWHLGSPSYKILRTIVKMDKWGTPINRPKNQEIDDYVQIFTPEMTLIDYMW